MASPKWHYADVTIIQELLCHRHHVSSCHHSALLCLAAPPWHFARATVITSLHAFFPPSPSTRTSQPRTTPFLGSGGSCTVSTVASLGLSHDLSSSYDSLSVDPLEGIFKDVTLRGARAFDPWEISRACRTTATQASMGLQCGPLASNSLAGLPMLAAPSTAIRAMKAIRASQAISALHHSVAVERFSASWRKMAPFSAAVTSFRVECFDFDTLEIWCDKGLTSGDMVEQLGHSSLCASSRQMGRPRSTALSDWRKASIDLSVAAAVATARAAATANSKGWLRRPERRLPGWPAGWQRWRQLVERVAGQFGSPPEGNSEKLSFRCDFSRYPTVAVNESRHFGSPSERHSDKLSFRCDFSRYPTVAPQSKPLSTWVLLCVFTFVRSEIRIAAESLFSSQHFRAHVALRWQDGYLSWRVRCSARHRAGLVAFGRGRRLEQSSATDDNHTPRTTLILATTSKRGHLSLTIAMDYQSAEDSTMNNPITHRKDPLPEASEWMHSGA
ncbi:hypothetical protein Q7P36_003752 [Cladosporium allicinum]